jgi:hypothetical protein
LHSAQFFGGQKMLFWAIFWQFFGNFLAIFGQFWAIFGQFLGNFWAIFGQFFGQKMLFIAYVHAYTHFLWPNLPESNST